MPALMRLGKDICERHRSVRDLCRARSGCVFVSRILASSQRVPEQVLLTRPPGTKLAAKGAHAACLKQLPETDNMELTNLASGPKIPSHLPEDTADCKEAFVGSFVWH